MHEIDEALGASDAALGRNVNLLERRPCDVDTRDRSAPAIEPRREQRWHIRCFLRNFVLRRAELAAEPDFAVARLDGNAMRHDETPGIIVIDDERIPRRGER